MTDSATGDRSRIWPVPLGLVLLAWAAVIALLPTLDGDNYCGRLYFDTQRTSPCQDTMARRSVWFLLLAGLGVAMLAWVVIATRRPRLMVAGLLGAIAVAAALIGFNRLLQPTPNTVFCGSVLNGHGPYEGPREERCEEFYSSMKRAATGAFAVSGVAGIGAALALMGSRRGVQPSGVDDESTLVKPRHRGN
jgi:hypothetical protein